ncbi:phage major capsid protein [Candidatus Pacearchaeota archaeon]|nr:phage major capsid protein [Candidatus Pacearchaeota archaeon]
MSSIEELQEATMAAGDEVSSSDITERIPEQWAATIEAKAEPKRIFRSLVRINTDLVGKPGDTIKMPRRGFIDFDTYAAADVASDLTEITPNVELSYETVSFTPTESAMATAITKEAIDEAMVSLIDDAMTNMAIGIAAKEDQDIATSLALPQAADLTYIEAETGAATFTTGNWDAAQAAAEQSNIGASDVLDLSVIVEASEVVMETQGFNADTIVIHPRQKASLLRDDNFLKAADSPTGTQAVKNGIIGTLFGLTVVSSQRVPTITISGGASGYQAMVLDSTAAGGLAIKRPVTVETEYLPGKRKHYIYVTTMLQAKRLNPGAVVLVNTA